MIAIYLFQAATSINLLFIIMLKTIGLYFPTQQFPEQAIHFFSEITGSQNVYKYANVGSDSRDATCEIHSAQFVTTLQYPTILWQWANEDLTFVFPANQSGTQEGTWVGANKKGGGTFRFLRDAKGNTYSRTGNSVYIYTNISNFSRS